MLEVPTFILLNLPYEHGAGSQPYEDIMARNDPWTCWTVHQMTEGVDAGPVVGQSPGISVADSHGHIVRDPKRFYDKLRGVVGPMATILIEELVRVGDGGRDGLVARIDFDEGFSR
jgi:hypothetical protein